MWRKPNESARPGSSEPSASHTTAAVASDIGDAPQSPAPEVRISPAPALAPAPVPALAGFPAPNQAASRIPSGIKINGQISGSADLFIDGTVKGNIRLPGARLTIGPHGHIEADLEAAEIFVEGVVTGNIKAADKAHFGPASRTKGSILAPRIGIQEGARLSGKVDMTASAVSSAGAPGASPAVAVAPAPVAPPAVSPAPASPASQGSVLASAVQQRQSKSPSPVGAGTEK